ncbi:helix-turn-helix domain-containing protein [Spirochaeta cellobiosiphila]|uniref:helix-turn-helix domain-containing protein n=1 Tax=Spirochaeta cellobiosiphila TaxID=504483 RepID=UPI000491080E|nr:helix-turn-helix domain-containing protein [Spirochaeta cellobiosiphila]
MSIILSKNYSLIISDSVNNCIENCHLEHPDLILTEITQPIEELLVFLESLRHSKEDSYIPIIVLSDIPIKGLSNEEIFKYIDDYIVKPIDTSTLLTRINIHLRYKTQLNKMNITRSKVLNEIDNLIELDLSNPLLSIDTICHDLGYSRSTLNRKILKLSGLSSQQYIQSYRLRRAMEMLQNIGDCNITEIAYKVGFSSSAYFTKCFKNKYGVLPSQFKQVK